MPATLRSNVVLTEAITHLWQHSVKPRTRAAYNTGFTCFERFLLMNGISWSAQTLPPISEDILLYFVAHCYHNLRLHYHTIRLYLCGIRFYYLWDDTNPFLSNSGFPLARLATCMQSIKKMQGPARPSRLPITGPLLNRMCDYLDTDVFNPFISVLLKAVFSTAFYGFLRCGEFTTPAQSVFDSTEHLCLGDLLIQSTPVCAQLKLKTSKTDLFRVGVTIQLFPTDTVSCPVRALKSYLHSRRQYPQLMAPDDPLFITDTGYPLSRPVFIQYLRRVLHGLREDTSHYTGHSFRIGAATTAANANVQDHLIKTLGRWSSECYQRYIRTPPAVLAQAQYSMSTCYQ